ncbi:UBX domain-containing protein 1-like [Patiria miniata]|uniref:UBX domain-containing protein 1 n=1 Tax=Patiria miniata TaxID=46514 RepID=A0A914BIF1_PATMI|nr:UBX domain-containing protein 1-like [Patiria miniata]
MPTDVETLMEMGFPENRAQRALAATQYKSVQVAMDWLFAHSDDPDIDEPFQAPEGHKLGGDTSQGTGEGGDSKSGEEEVPTAEGAPVQAKSLKCDECGKKLRTPEDVQVHAARTGHGNFSESIEEIKPLTAEEKQEQMLRLQEKMKQRQKEKAELAKKEEVEREKLRRKKGKDLVEAKHKMEMDEVKKLAELKKREKQEERLARQKVREEIERDKRERAARYAKTSAETTHPKPATQPTAPQQPAAPKKEYDSTRLQIRLPNGSALTNSFGVSEQLAAVRLFVEVNRKDGSNAPFTLMTNFPKKVYTEEDMEKPLKELGLVPSAVLMVTKPTS